MSGVEQSPGLALCGMIINEFFERGLDVLDPIQALLADVPDGALAGEELRLFQAIGRALEEGHPATTTNIQAADPALPISLIVRARKLGGDGDGYAAIRSAIGQILHRHTQRQMTERLTRALALVQKGQLSEAGEEVAQIDLTALHGPGKSESRYADFERRARAPRPFELTHEKMNIAIGGGLGSGWPLAMSLWVAPTGMGKSTFWWKEIPYLAKQGHWVLYFAAESDAESIYAEITRIEANMTEEAIEKMEREGIPKFVADFDRAVAELKDVMGRSLIIWNDEFDCRTITRRAEQALREMREAGASGKLLVIVDNYDALYEKVDTGKGGAMAINEEIHRLSRHAGQHDYHVAMLAQSTAEDEVLAGPGSGAVYGNRKIGQKFSQVFALYRPKTPEAEALTNPDGTPHPGSRPCVAIRKARFGKRNAPRVIQMSPDSTIGVWTEVGSLGF